MKEQRIDYEREDKKMLDIKSEQKWPLIVRWKITVKGHFSFALFYFEHLLFSKICWQIKKIVIYSKGNDDGKSNPPARFRETSHGWKLVAVKVGEDHSRVLRDERNATPR